MRVLWVVGIAALALALSSCASKQQPETAAPEYAEPEIEEVMGAEEAMAAEEVAERRAMLQELLSRIHRVNRFGMEIGTLAQTNASSDKVKQLAKEIAAHRSQLDNQVQEMVRRENLQLVEPTPVSEADREVMTIQNTIVQELRDLRGEEFDQLFLTSVVLSRAEVLPILRELAEETTDQEVRAMLKNSIPVLEREYATALGALAEQYQAGEGISAR